MFLHLGHVLAMPQRVQKNALLLGRIPSPSASASSGYSSRRFHFIINVMGRLLICAGAVVFALMVGGDDDGV